MPSLSALLSLPSRHHSGDVDHFWLPIVSTNRVNAASSSGVQGSMGSEVGITLPDARFLAAEGEFHVPRLSFAQKDRFFRNYTLSELSEACFLRGDP